MEKIHCAPLVWVMNYQDAEEIAKYEEENGITNADKIASCTASVVM